MPLAEDQAALLPEEIRSDPTVNKYNDIGSLAKGLIEAQSLVGRSIQLPSKDSKPEDIEKWQQDASVRLKDHGYTIAKPSEPPPKGPEAYAFKVEGIPDQALIEDVAVNKFRSFAHQNGMSNAKANEFINFYAKEVAPALYAEMHKEDVPWIDDPKEVETIIGREFGNEASARREEFNQVVETLAQSRQSLKDAVLNGISKYGTPPRWVDNKDNPEFIWAFSEFARTNLKQDFGGHVAGLTAADTMDTVEGEISTLRAQANSTQDQIEREKIGMKIADLYKKKEALQMRNGRAS
jgi:hypothetical protein